MPQPRASSPPQQGWEDVEKLPDYWRNRWPDHNGSVWYRIEWQHNCEPLALMIDSIVMAGEVFVNESRLWRDRNLVEPLSRSWAMPRYWQIPNEALSPGANTIWVRVIGRAEDNAGIGVVKLGSAHHLQDQFESVLWHSRTLPLFNIIASAVLGLLAFGIWLLYPAHRVFGWYSLVALLWVVFTSNMLTTETRPFPDNLAVQKFSTLSYCLYVVSFCVFTWRLLQLDRTVWLERGLAVITLVLSVSIFLTSASPMLAPVSNFLSLLFVFNCAFLVWRVLSAPSWERIAVAGCLLVILALAVRDVAVYLGWLASRISCCITPA